MAIKINEQKYYDTDMGIKPKLKLLGKSEKRRVLHFANTSNVKRGFLVHNMHLYLLHIGKTIKMNSITSYVEISKSCATWGRKCIFGTMRVIRLAESESRDI